MLMSHCVLIVASSVFAILTLRKSAGCAAVNAFLVLGGPFAPLAAVSRDCVHCDCGCGCDCAVH